MKADAQGTASIRMAGRSSQDWPGWILLLVLPAVVLSFRVLLAPWQFM
jgi:hypothetical protein